MKTLLLFHLIVNFSSILFASSITTPNDHHLSDENKKTELIDFVHKWNGISKNELEAKDLNDLIDIAIDGLKQGRSQTTDRLLTDKMDKKPPFSAILPKPLQFGDKIILKGKIKNDAKVFSVNFLPESSLNIVYHFRTDFDTQKVRHNHKTSGNWNDEVVDDNTWINGPGHEFTLTFFFDDKDIIVYNSNDFQYSFEQKLDIGSIKSVQAWGDVDYISEIAFYYKNEKKNK